MKNKIILFLLCISYTIFASAQSTNFNYQGIARNNEGAPLANQQIRIRVSIIDNTASGTSLYSETHETATNAFGLYTVAIGGGEVVSGDMTTIDWGGAAKFVKVEIDPTGGTDYTNLGTKELLSVPYAMYAHQGAPGPEGPIGPQGPTGPAGPEGPAGNLTGPAGGDLSGNYPNPNIADNAVTTAKIAANAVSTAKIANSAVTAAKLADMGAANGQVLKYNGTAWAPADAGGAGWGLTGNIATATSFIGTTNAEPLQFKVNNNNGGQINSTSNNTAMGYEALNSVTPDIATNNGMNNSSFGFNALKANTTGFHNIAIGSSALEANTTGMYNVAIGGLALSASTAPGGRSTAVGHSALMSNTTGSRNSAFGFEALKNNLTGGSNTAFGYYALLLNTASWNSAFGSYAQHMNTEGTNNCAFGMHASKNNSLGSENSAFGVRALLENTGTGNTAVGSEAMNAKTDGDNNTAIGYNTVINSGLTNSTAIGYGAVADNSNLMRFGDNSITSIGGQVGWSNFSDSRIKTNVQENVPGLMFINALRPVTYNLDIHAQNKIMGIDERKNDANIKTLNNSHPKKYEIEKITFSGFIAQEVEAAAKKVGYDFSGIQAAKGDKDLYSLRYAEFVVPMVKAIQEQQAIIEELKKKIEILEAQMK